MEEKIKSLIGEVLEKMDIKTEDVSYASDNVDQTLWCLIKTKEPQFFLGKNGEVLQALNHITRKMAEKHFFDQDPDFNRALMKFSIDVNNYQKNKIDNLRTTAHMLSERAKFFKSDIETDPMSAFDRRIVHEFLSSKPGIKTESIGLDPKRRVVIRYSVEEKI